MGPDDLRCSRNARLQKALVGRAQWEINQPPSLLPPLSIVFPRLERYPCPG